MNYYDFVLALIPLTVVGIAVALVGVGVELSFAVPVGALAVLPVIGHAMFVRAPGRHRPARSEACQDETQQTQTRQMNTAD